MSAPEPINWKSKSQQQWNNYPCGSQGDVAGDLKYFLEVEERKQSESPWIPEVLDFGSYRGKRVLDIGHGQGNDLCHFAAAGAICYGVDITERHHQLAEKNLACRGLNATLILTDAARLPFEDESFDLVYSMGVLHHTPDTIRCISEAYRVLKPGGKFVISLYNRHSAYHIVNKLIYEGFIQRKYFSLGYDGLLSTIEMGADGKNIKPLVKLYSKNQLQYLLGDFRQVKVSVRQLEKSHFALMGYIIPRPVIKLFDHVLGWYVIGEAIK